MKHNESLQSALVTGARGGIGSAICKKFIEDGYFVYCVFKPGYTANDVLDWARSLDIPKEKYEVVFIDVTNHEQCNTVISDIINRDGPIDVLVNNAGITRDSSFRKMTLTQWNEVVSVNLNCLFNVTQSIFNAMCEQEYGRIINISSINGLKGQYGQTNYSATKAGIIGFTKSLALEGARYNVTVNSVAPGYTATNMLDGVSDTVMESIKKQIPIGRLSSAEEIAFITTMLANKLTGSITGETLSINGGHYM